MALGLVEELVKDSSRREGDDGGIGRLYGTVARGRWNKSMAGGRTGYGEILMIVRMSGDYLFSCVLG